MNKYLLAVLALPLLLLSCSSDDEDSDELRYYIKYEAEAYTYHPEAPKFLTAATDTGFLRLKVDDAKTFKWTKIYGPLKKDFVAILNCNGDEYYNSHKNFFGRISVAIEDEPFIVKAEGEGDMVSLKYTVGN